MINPRAIFPVIMFGLAALSFGFGIWQYAFAQQVQASATKRLAFVMTTIERSGLAAVKKQELYASIASGLPKAPKMIGIDVSGSFASRETQDVCVSDGQRAICQALAAEKTDIATMSAICGVCNSK